MDADFSRQKRKAGIGKPNTKGRFAPYKKEINNDMSIETISLSGSKKEVSNKKMTFWESLYLVAIVKGLFITISHLFTRKVTIKYPEEVKSRSDIWRGQHMLMRDDEGRERCTACGLCALSCPAEAITMKAEERTKDELH